MIFFKSILSFLQDPDYRSLLLTTLVVMLLGTMVYNALEDWRYIDSLYFSVITLTTIGYGDFAPQTDAGKIFTIFYIIMGLGIILSFINTVYAHYNKSVKKKKFDKHKDTLIP